MTILSIRTLGDPVLREQARAVERFDDGLRRLVDDMFETMYAAPGVGLAAPQVGMSSRFFVYDDGDGHKGFVANAVLSDHEEEQTHDEGCLSIPGPFYPTTRALKVTLRGQDPAGRPIQIEAEGLLARIFQHEIDHTKGMLYIDRLDDEGRREVMRMLREQELRRAQERSQTL
ncbi:MAG TPA: peptide deformylase [Actinomycetota bacterium]